MKKTFTKKSMLSIVSVCAISVMALTACGGSGSSKEEKKSSGETKTFDVGLHDTPTAMKIESEPISVPAGTNVTLNVTNTGTVVHNLKLDGGPTTADLPTNAAATLELGELTESTTVYCTIAGHKEQGMVMDITVE